MKKPLTRQACHHRTPAGCERQDSADPQLPACSRRWRSETVRSGFRFGSGPRVRSVHPLFRRLQGSLC